MSSTIFLSVASFCYIFMLVVIYFSKDKVNTSETRVFTRLLLVSFASLFSELYITLIPINLDILLFRIALKVYLILCVLWLSFFMEYVFIITRNDKQKSQINYKENYKKVYLIFWSIVTLLIFAIIMLPINFFNENGMKYSYGPSVNIVFGLSAVYVMIMLFYILKNIKQLKKNGYFTIILLVILMTIVSIVQKNNPSLLLANTCFAIITTLMYHTIENPDIKMVDELIRNRKIINRTNEEKSLFYFKMTQEMRNIIKHNIYAIDSYNKLKITDENINNIIKDINMNNEKMEYLIQDAMGINVEDNQKIKVIETSYNIHSLLKELEKRIKQKISNNIDFQINYSMNMPEELYGDSIKLKQVLTTILTNSAEHTSLGYIHMDIASITKYDSCRLVISIKDSGTGISMSNINKILESDIEIEDDEYKKLDSLDTDLMVASKIIKKLNGTMYIQSEIDQGTEVIITLDQSIKNENEKKNKNIIERYIRTRDKTQRVLIVDEDEEETERIKRIVEKMGYSVYTSHFGEDCIDKIQNGELFDIILINDEMKTINGITLLNRLNKIDKVSKKIILLEKDKIFISKHYITDGFDEYINKENLVDELHNKI